MSDDAPFEVEEEKESKKKKDANDKVRPRTEPHVERPDLVEWLLALWEKDVRSPSMIELYMTRYIRKQLHRTSRLRQFSYPATSRDKPPSREEIVDLSHTLLRLAQNNCNTVEKPQLYGVIAYQFGSASDMSGVFSLNLKPTERPEGEDGTGHAGLGGDDEDGMFPDSPLGAMLRYSLEQNKESLADRRFMMREFRESMSGIVEHIAEENGRLSGMVQEGFKQMLDMYKTQQQILNEDQERKNKARWNEVGVSVAEKGAEMFMNLLPPAINRIAGKEIVPATTSMESVILGNFIKSCDEEQSRLAFGYQGDGQPPFEDSIFTPAQVALLTDIATCKASGDRIDDFLPGGAVEIKQNQLERLLATGKFDMMQLYPVRDLFTQRLKVRGGANGAVPPPSPKPPA